VIRYELPESEDTCPKDGTTLIEIGVEVSECKYLNNIVEEDHRAIKRITKPMLGFKDFRCARIILFSIELMHMIRKGQMQVKKRHLSVSHRAVPLAG
jgi:transposase-like protein